MNRKSVIVVVGVLFIALLLTMYLLFFRWRSIAVPDVSHAAVFTVSSRAWDCWPLKEPSGLSVRVIGEIDGAAEVWADDWPPQRIEGHVDWQVYHDWFEHGSHLHYRPLTATSGHIVIQYQFE